MAAAEQFKAIGIQMTVEGTSWDDISKRMFGGDGLQGVAGDHRVRQGGGGEGDVDLSGLHGGKGGVLVLKRRTMASPGTTRK